MDAGAAAFPPELTAILARAEIDLTLERDALEEAPHGAIAARRDSRTWSGGHTWWVVEFNGSEPHGFFMASSGSVWKNSSPGVELGWW
jgi:hypothetical protein